VAKRRCELISHPNESIRIRPIPIQRMAATNPHVRHQVALVALLAFLLQLRGVHARLLLRLQLPLFDVADERHQLVHSGRRSPTCGEKGCESDLLGRWLTRPFRTAATSAPSNTLYSLCSLSALSQQLSALCSLSSPTLGGVVSSPELPSLRIRAHTTSAPSNTLYSLCSLSAALCSVLSLLPHVGRCGPLT
jgi:hypothetical protein